MNLKIRTQDIQHQQCKHQGLGTKLQKEHLIIYRSIQQKCLQYYLLKRSKYPKWSYSESFTALSSFKSGKRQDILSDILQRLFRIRQTRIVSMYHLFGCRSYRGRRKGSGGSNSKRSIKTFRHRDECSSECILDVKDMWQRKWDSDNNGRDLYSVQRIVGNRREDSIIRHSALNQFNI